MVYRKELVRFLIESWKYKGWKMLTPRLWSVWKEYYARVKQAEEGITINRNITRKQYVIDRKKSRKLNKEINNDKRRS